MKSLRILVCLQFVIVFVQNIFAAGLAQDEVYKLLSEKGQKISSLRFNFKQEIVGASSVKNIISGKIEYKTPNQFKVVYKNPEMQYIYNGQKLIVYDKAKNQVLSNSKDDSAFFGKEIIDFFKFDDSLQSKYKITSFWEEEKFYCFIFTDIDTKYKVNLFIDKKQLYSKKIIWDKDYMKFIITIEDIKFNSKLDDSDFEFKIKDDMKFFEV